MLTLGEEMSRIGRHYGNRTAVVDESSSLSWKDFSTRIATAAGMLRGLGTVSYTHLTLPTLYSV